MKCGKKKACTNAGKEDNGAGNSQKNKVNSPIYQNLSIYNNQNRRTLENHRQTLKFRRRINEIGR
ncbi:MAG: hypothetical protein SFU91_14730 [Chloroherpetonaceae bacterium]|nr:hypothetical protein [Chloroherpetonaceae bacterium]